MSVGVSVLSKFLSGPGRRSADTSRRRLVVALGMTLALAACGRKGALELPPVDPAPVDPLLGDDPLGDETE